MRLFPAALDSDGINQLRMVEVSHTFPIEVIERDDFVGSHGSIAQRVIHDKDIRDVKNASGMAMLSCKNSERRENVPWSYVLAYNPIRLLMTRAAVQSQTFPREVSLPPTMRVWLLWRHKQFLSDAAEDLPAFFRMIAYVRVGKRPRRIESRAVKRRAKPFLRVNTPHRGARRNIRLYGHSQKLWA